MSRYVRYLRIMFSAACGIACVLLIVLWVRSYWWVDAIGLPTAGTTIVSSVKGQVFVQRHRQQKIDPPGWWWNASEVSQMSKDGALSLETGPRWYYNSNSANTWGGFPLWFPILAFATFAAASWIRRFTLRTLLIATTLVAVVLGLIVWAMQ